MKVINDKPGEAGGKRREPQAANGPEGESPIEQVARAGRLADLPSRLRVRAVVRILQHRGAGTCTLVPWSEDLHVQVSLDVSIL